MSLRETHNLNGSVKRWLSSVIFGALNLAALVAFVWIMVLGFEPLAGQAATGIYKALNFRGTLKNNDSSSVADGNYNMQFTIYDASTGGNCLYTARGTCGTPTAKSVAVTSGVFSTLIGDTDNSDNAITIDFNSNTYWLGVTVGSDAELAPRVRIGASGYAFNADLLDGLNTSSNGGTTSFVPVTNNFGNLTLTGEPRTSYVSSSTFYVNPSVATSTFPLLGLAVGGIEQFRISASGTVAASGTIYSAGTGTSTIVGNMEIQGNMRLGDTSSDSIQFSGTVSSNILPFTNNLYDLGSYAASWKDIYSSGTVRVATNVIVNGQSVCLQNGANCGTLSNWQIETNYGANALTPTSTIPVWVKSGLYASSTLTVAGSVTSSNLYPWSNNNYDIGAYAAAWRNVYASGTIYGSIATSTWYGSIATTTFYGSLATSTWYGNIATSTFYGSLATSTWYGNIATSTWYASVATTTFDGVTIGGSTAATGTFTGLIANQTASFNGIVNIGDNGDAVVVNSNTWDISSAGVTSNLSITTSTLDGVTIGGSTAAKASTTLLSAYSGLFVGTTATTSIYGTATSTFGAGLQTTALNITSNSVTSTFANGIQIASGCYLMPDGSCAGAGSGWTDDGAEIRLTTSGDNVTVGGAGNLAKLTVLGDADEKQFVIKANATQNANIFEIQNSSSAPIAWVSPTGNFGVSGTIYGSIATSTFYGSIATSTFYGSLATSTWYASVATTTFDGVTIGGSTAATGTFTGLIANQTTSLNGIVNIGDNGDAVVVNSNTWDISSAGVISGAQFSTTTLDGVTIGGSTRAAGNFTNLDFNGTGVLGDGGDDIAINSNDWDISSVGVATSLSLSTSTLDNVIIGGSTATSAYFTRASSTFLSVFNTIWLGGTVTSTFTTGNRGLATSTLYSDLSIINRDVLIGGAANTGWLWVGDGTATTTIRGGTAGSATSTFAGDVSIENLYSGQIQFSEDGGVVGALNLPVSASAATGTEEGYTFDVDNLTVARIIGTADALGSVWDPRLELVKGDGTATTTIRGISTASSTFAAGIQTAALNITSNSVTSTFANGVQLSGGCFRDNSGNCISVSGSNAWTDGGAEIYLTTSGDNVTVGASGNLAKLTVLGDADEKQFVIRANATQNANVFESQNSSGVPLAWINSSGGIGSSGTIYASGSGTSTFSYGATFASLGGNIIIGNPAGADELSKFKVVGNGVIGSATANATGTYAFASGDSSQAGGYASVALGHQLEAYGDYSVALGINVTARGAESVAIGDNVEVNGAGSVGIGLNPSTTQIITANSVMAILGGKLGVGTTAPSSTLEVMATADWFGIGNGTATTTIRGSGTSTVPYGSTFATTGGNVGVGTSNPQYLLELFRRNASPLFGFGNGSVTSTLTSGNRGAATSTFYSDLSIVSRDLIMGGAANTGWLWVGDGSATTTIRGGTAGSATSTFQGDVVISNLYSGLIEMTEDGGIVPAMNISIASAATGTTEGYTFDVDGLSTLFVGGTSDGLASVWNKRVGVNTITPSSTLEVIGTFAIGNGSTSATFYANTTSTFQQGLNVATSGGTLAVNNVPVCLSTGANCTTGGATAAGWTDGGAEVYLTTSGDNVTVGASGNLAKLTVLGDADEKQFVIRNNATQNYNPFEIQNSSGVPLAWINPSGGFGSSGTIYASGNGTSTFSYGATFASLGGNIGIGIATPSSTLQIYRPGVGPSLEIGDGVGTSTLREVGLQMDYSGIQGYLQGNVYNVYNAPMKLKTNGAYSFQLFNDNLEIGRFTEVGTMLVSNGTTATTTISSTVTSTFAYGIAPTTNNSIDFGAYAAAWRNIYASGTIYGGAGSYTITDGLSKFSNSSGIQIGSDAKNITLFTAGGGEDITSTNDLHLNYNNGKGVFVGQGGTSAFSVSGTSTLQGTILAASGGNVGVGTSSPKGKLMIDATNNGAGDHLAIVVPSNSAGNAISIYQAGTAVALTYINGSGEIYSRNLYPQLASNDVGGSGNKWNNVYGLTGRFDDLYVAGVNAINSSGQFRFGATNQTERVCHDGGEDATAANLSDCNTSPGDIAEYYGSLDTTIEAGDVVKIAEPQNGKPYIQKTADTYDGGVIGIISTAPYDVFGRIYSTTTEYSVPVALAGRVPVKVSNENGPVAVGDYLTSASMPGYAMKMTAPGVTLGRALTPFDGSSPTSTVEVFANTGYYNGLEFANFQGTQDLTMTNDPSNIGPILAKNGIDMASSSIINVASVAGINWKIDEGGNFTTAGEIVKKVATSAGEKNLYPAYTGDPTMMLTGSGSLVNGEARIIFDPVLTEILDPAESVKVTVAMTSEGAQNIYVAEKSIGDILVRETNGGKGGASFDYIIVAKRKIDGAYSSPLAYQASSTNNNGIPAFAGMTGGGDFPNSLLPQDMATSTTESVIVLSTSTPEISAPIASATSTPATAEPIAQTPSSTEPVAIGNATSTEPIVTESASSTPVVAESGTAG